MRKLLKSVALPLLLLLPLPMLAQEKKTHLVIEPVAGGGVEMVLCLDYKPVVTFSGQDGETLLVSYAGSSFEFEADKIARFYFEDRPDALGSITHDQVVVRQVGRNQYEVSGLLPYTSVRVYDMNGRNLGVQTASASGVVRIDMEGNAAGVYVIQVNQEQTFKVQKR